MTSRIANMFKSTIQKIKWASINPVKDMIPKTYHPSKPKYNTVCIDSPQPISQFTYYVLSNDQQIIKTTSCVDLQSIDELILSHVNNNNNNQNELKSDKQSITMPLMSPNGRASASSIEFVWWSSRDSSGQYYRNRTIDHILTNRYIKPFNQIGQYSNVLIFRKSRVMNDDDDDDDDDIPYEYEYIDIELTPDELRDVLIL